MPPLTNAGGLLVPLSAIGDVLFGTREWALAPEGFPPPGPSLPQTERARLAAILLDAGILLTAATTRRHPSSWYPLFRYFDAFEPGLDELRLAARVQTLDPRLLAVLAEELAVGIAGYIARTHFGVCHISDVYGLMRHGGTLVSFASPRVDGDARPDFLAIDALNRGMFIESKGAVGQRSRLTASLATGKNQVRNVESVYAHNPAGYRLVIGTHFCVASSHRRSKTTTVILDPPDSHVPLEATPLSDFAVRLAYAKALNFTGNEDLAERLLRAEEWPGETLAPLRSPRRDENVEGLRVLGPFPLGGSVVIDEKVWQALRRHEAGSLNEALPGVLRGTNERHIGKAVVMLTNGIGLHPGDERA